MLEFEELLEDELELEFEELLDDEFELVFEELLDDVFELELEELFEDELELVFEELLDDEFELEFDELFEDELVLTFGRAGVTFLTLPGNARRRSAGRRRASVQPSAISGSAPVASRRTSAGIAEGPNSSGRP